MALSLVRQAMASTRVVLLLVLSILQLAPMVCPRLDEATREHMLQRAVFLKREMAQHLQQLEQVSLKETARQSNFSWGSLFAVVKDLWVIPGNLVLLVELCSWQNDFHEEEWLVRERFQCSVWGLACKRWEMETVVGDLLGVLQERLSKSFFLVPQPAIRVGSAFEGWSPHGHDAVFSLLVPLKPPHRHAFHMELGTARDAPAKHHVRVDLACTCTKDTREEDMLCFVHQPHEALERKQDSRLLSNLCTGRYLDAQKTACWFQDLVSSAWEEVPHSRCYPLRVLPSRRSCKLELTSASGRSLIVEMLFGVQQGDSDILLNSQAPEAIFTPGTTWAESSAVAETKVHLQCLQLCTSSLIGTVLSSYTFRMVVMHLLNMYPVMNMPFTIQLQDIMCYLCSCLEEKRLHHFIFGNECLPEGIILPQATQRAEPVNLFQCLVQDPEAYTNALWEFQELQGRLTGLLVLQPASLSQAGDPSL
uniref:Inositol 1,4,5-trisphosphate receptor-interacting protein-like 1 n=1 Tax=Calidris pygmaea TaxID=425635 RepID=A0A8C3KPK9_9CHAR